MYKLTNWYIVGERAYGNVFNNPSFPDGTFIRTSDIKESDGLTIKTQSGSIYELCESYVASKPVMNLTELTEKVAQWGWDTDILKYSDPKSQALKTVSEVGEFADNVAKGRDCKDDIGDIIVTLIMQAELQGTTIRDCLELAYNEIAKRKGKMVNGVFIKEGDVERV